MPILHARFQCFVRTRGHFLAAGIAMGEDMLDLRSGLRFAPVGLRGPRVHRTIPRLPAVGIAAINRKSGPRSALRRKRRLPATTFAIRCGTAATVGDRMVSNPIKPAQSPVSKQSSNIAAFRVNADVVALAGINPLRLDHVESKSAPPFFIVSNSLIAVDNDRGRQGRNEHASSHPEIIGLEVSRHCLISISCPKTAGIVRRARTKAVRNWRGRCDGSFFASASGQDPRPDRTLQRNRGELAPGLRSCAVRGRIANQSFEIMPKDP